MKQECEAGKTCGCRDSKASDKEGDGRHWATAGWGGGMRVIVEDQGERIGLNHLLGNELKGHN